MSANVVVAAVALVAFAAGTGFAVRFWPPADTGRAGELVWWASRLVAGAAVATLTLEIYATVKNMSERDLPTELDAIDLADGLSSGLYQAGVLLALAVGLALVGTLLQQARHVDDLDDDPDAD